MVEGAVNGLSRALHKLCWNVIQDCWGRGKLFSHKFSAMLSLREGGTPFWKAVLWVTLEVDDGLFQVCALSVSPENKKVEGAKGHKSPLTSSFCFRVLFSHAQICDSFFQSSKPRFQLSLFFGFFQKGEKKKEIMGFEPKGQSHPSEKQGRLTKEIDRNGCCGGEGLVFCFSGFLALCPICLKGEMGGESGVVSIATSELCTFHAMGRTI